MVPLKIAAAAFSESQDAGMASLHEAHSWLRLPQNTVEEGMFAAQVFGESIPE